MPINRNPNLVFVHIPKCGGTSIEKLLGMSGIENYYTKLGIGKKTPLKNVSFASNSEYELARIRNLQHLTLKQISCSLEPEFVESAFVFSVVRNPYTRIVSEYYHCLNGGNRIASSFKNICSSFDEFVATQLDLPEPERIEKYDGHLETQASYLLNSAGNLDDLDTIYRFETLQTDMQDLWKYAAVKKHVHAKIGSYNKNFSEIYSSQQTIEKIKQFYAQDFELFNYDLNTIPE